MEESPNSLLQRMRNGSLMKSPCMLRFEDEWSGREDFAKCKGSRPVFVRCAGRIGWFPSAGEAAKACGFTRNYLNCLISGKRTSSEGFQVRRAESTDDWNLLQSDLRALAERGVCPDDPLSFGEPLRHRRARRECTR